MRKAKSSVTNQAAHQWKAYLTEDIRAEMDGRVSLIGFYPGDVVFLNLPATAPDPTPDSAVGVSSVAILLTLTNVTQPEEIELELIAPNGAVITQGSGTVAVGEASNLISRFRPFAVSSFGEWTWAVKGPTIDIEYKFRVLRNPLVLPSDSDPIPKPIVKPAAKKKLRPSPKAVA